MLRFESPILRGPIRIPAWFVAMDMAIDVGIGILVGYLIWG